MAVGRPRARQHQRSTRGFVEQLCLPPETDKRSRQLAWSLLQLDSRRADMRLRAGRPVYTICVLSLAAAAVDSARGQAGVHLHARGAGAAVCERQHAGRPSTLLGRGQPHRSSGHYHPGYLRAAFGRRWPPLPATASRAPYPGLRNAVTAWAAVNVHFTACVCSDRCSPGECLPAEYIP